MRITARPDRFELRSDPDLRRALDAIRTRLGLSRSDAARLAIHKLAATLPPEKWTDQ